MEKTPTDFYVCRSCAFGGKLYIFVREPTIWNKKLISVQTAGMFNDSKDVAIRKAQAEVNKKPMKQSAFKVV